MGRAKNLRGFTLLELLTAMTILTIVGLFATPILYSVYRSFEASNAQMRLQNHLHLAMREIVDYIEASMPLPGSGSTIGTQSVIVDSTGTQITVYNFMWVPPGGLPVQTAAFQNSLNYSTTVIKYDTATKQITASRTGGGLPDSMRTLGVPEQAQSGAPDPVRFSEVKFEQVRDNLNQPVQNGTAVTLKAEAKTHYGTIEQAALTVTATARGRRAGN